jgi:hypothetical protein
MSSDETFQKFILLDKYPYKRLRYTDLCDFDPDPMSEIKVMTIVKLTSILVRTA